MSSTISSRHDENNSLGARVFKDICEALAIARAKRSEYFNGTIRSWYRSDRAEQGKKGHIN